MSVGKVCAIIKVIFSYTGSPQVKISQKVLGGLLFCHTVYATDTIDLCDLTNCLLDSVTYFIAFSVLIYFTFFFFFQYDF